ncbi:MAG: hypothetical protein ACXADF_14560 [Candidatus Thorarchaeota archaeon]|jgi:hypothetical protein
METDQNVEPKKKIPQAKKEAIGYVVGIERNPDLEAEAGYQVSVRLTRPNDYISKGDTLYTLPELVVMGFDYNNPYEYSALQLIEKAMNIHQGRLKTRGENYDNVWKRMLPRHHAALIMVKALRLEQAILDGLPDDIIEENMKDMLNYLIFLGTHFFKREEEELEDLEIREEVE